jgi:hypothetical protein
MRTQNRTDKGAKQVRTSSVPPTVGAEVGGGGAGGRDRDRAAGEPDEGLDPGRVEVDHRHGQRSASWCAFHQVPP